MTREEAITQVRLLRDMAYTMNDNRMKEAVDMAIQALQTEPCEDAISRQAVLDLIEHYNSDGLGAVFYGYEEGVKFADAVNKLPSVTAECNYGGWVRSDNPNFGIPMNEWRWME